jgi:hypothetical protein
MSRMPLIIAAFSAVAFAVILLGLYLPLIKPAPTLTAAGKVVDRVFDPAHTVGKVGYGMKAGNQIQVGDQYLIDVRLDSGEVLRGTWPAHSIDNLPVGARVNVRFQRRALLLLWKRTFVDAIEPLASE